MGLDNVVENVLSDKTELSVDSGSGTSGKVPLVSFVMRHGWVRVLQESDEHKPVVNTNVWDDPVDQDVESTVVLVPSVQNEKLSQDTDVRKNNVPVLFLLENSRSWVKVVHSPTGWRNLLTGDVGEKVHDPSKQLLGNQSVQGDDWGVGSNLLEDMCTSALDKHVPGLWNEHHISVHVASSLVVLRVGEFPGEVRNEPERVQNPTNGVIDQTRVGEGLVTTLVGQNPNTSTEKSLDDGVCGPSSESQVDVWQRRDVCVCNVTNGEHGGDVLENVPEGLGKTALITVCWNGRQDVLDGVVRSLKLVTVGVDGCQFLSQRGDISGSFGGFGGTSTGSGR